VADVGDVHVQRVVAVGQAVHPHGVVEIARGFAIDGDDVHAAEIAAAGEIASAIDAGMACACSITSGGNWCGRWCLRMTISTSTPKSSGWPRISITRPTGWRRARGTPAVPR
jgi:hypothetical protein